jgi:hypothetical protein
MPPVPDGSAGPAGQAVVNDYDSFAEAYPAGNQAGLINGYYTRPAILDLAGASPDGGSLTPAAALAPCQPRCATAVPPSPASTPAPGCWSWPGSGSVPARSCLADLGRPLPFPDGAFVVRDHPRRQPAQTPSACQPKMMPKQSGTG